MLNLIGKLETNGHYRKRPEPQITTLVIHHSGEMPPADGDWERQIRAFAHYHTQIKGWPGIGYHYCIAPDGTVYKCNAYTTISYHAKGGNASGIGICLLGNFDKMPVPDVQWRAAKALCKELRKAIPSVKSVLGHQQVKGSHTACPGRAIMAILSELN